jgi:predicted dehydrogenase
MKPRILMVGAGGYGQSYLEILFTKLKNKEISLSGIVSTSGAKGNRFLPQIEEYKIPVFSSIEEFLKENNADMAIISSPIQYHLPHTKIALQAGMNVLCEKPVSAVIQDALKMEEEEEKSGRFVSIGYDWSFVPSIQKLKKDIMSGEFGKAVRLKTITLWPRTLTYYSRNRWAGKIKDSENNWVLDSPANNATAHYLHNMLYLLGNTTDSSLFPESISAELYKANHIENYDSAVFKLQSENGPEILFYTTHASPEHRGPDFEFEFEKGKIFYKFKEGLIKAEYNSGYKKTYGNPNEERLSMPKIDNAVSAFYGLEKIFCGIKAACPHTICVNGAQESNEVNLFPREMVKFQEKENGDRIIYADGLFECFSSCYERNILPSEYGVQWAVKGKRINLKEYKFFPGLQAAAEASGF